MSKTVKKVKCELCGQTVSSSNYSKHLRRHENHPETFKESYHLDHNDLFCKFCGKECKNKNSLIQHEIRCKNNSSRICTTIDGFNSTGRVAWNKGLTKETDDRVKRYGESFSLNYKLGKHVDRTGDKNPSRKKYVRDKISNTCLMKSKNGDWHTSLAKNMHYNYNGIDLHGEWELKYAEYLTEQHINWIRPKNRFEYIFEDKIHYYTPDFYLVDSSTFIEIKGYKTFKDECKWEQFPRDKQLKVLRYKDLVELGLDIHN